MFTCVYVFLYVHVHMHADTLTCTEECVNSRGKFWVLFLKSGPLLYLLRQHLLVARHPPNRLDWAAREPQPHASLHFPSIGITSMACYACIFWYGLWGWNSYPYAQLVRTLPVELLSIMYFLNYKTGNTFKKKNYESVWEKRLVVKASEWSWWTLTPTLSLRSRQEAIILHRKILKWIIGGSLGNT